MTAPDKPQRWDIFCRIVDNYGDIGVCWRLARQLTDDHGIRVRLWVDDLAVAQRLIPAIDLRLPSQRIEDVEIAHWTADFPDTTVADVVIEAFACELPPRYLNAMASARPVWLNLEYLSAESWVADFHLRPSPHPRLPLTKYFYFPGFVEESGGLLREQGLITAREAFQRSPQAQAAFCRRLGIDRLRSAISSDRDSANSDSMTMRVSLFCYGHAAIDTLLADMAASAQPIHCLVSDPQVTARIEAWLGQPMAPGTTESRGNLHVLRLPFLSQDDYDRLLWLCDLNFVRGEDSWLRALWAGKPAIWQPYRQEEDAHQAKLEAYLVGKDADLEDELRAELQAIHRAWAEGRWHAGSIAWLQRHLTGLQAHAERYCHRLARQPDLATKLVIFCGNLF